MLKRAPYTILAATLLTEIHNFIKDEAKKSFPSNVLSYQGSIKIQDNIDNCSTNKISSSMKSIKIRDSILNYGNSSLMNH